ncbi:hypothetical protein NLJ89_g12066 [Agrocybe chaxingu]|uniref:Uncharacterized protein n=1 Tax=Agrocybe chaxingu TaxID=84603 RepID=A0A9W8JKP8_9AGAR|nr:hypothetical protein NLJ89_g12066 [Agrocybe chaxingu]
MTSIVSQGCAGIDGQAPGTFRKRSLTYRGLREERKRHRDSEKNSTARELVEQSEELEERAEETETEEEEGKNLKMNEGTAPKEPELERRAYSRVRRRH